MKRLVLKGFAVTSFVFLTMWGVSKLTDLKLFNAFDPISQALAEFELTDWVFSKLRPEPKPDERIIIVNIAPTRRAIAEQIRIISQYNPKVIGVDGFFNCEGGLTDTLNCPQLLDTLGNLLLSNAIQEANNVVLVSRLLQTDSLAHSGTIDVYDSIEYSDSMFRFNAYNAFANLVTGATYQEDVKICKTVIPKMNVNGKEEIAFSARIAMLYDSVKAKKFLHRNKEEEIINFRGNAEIPDVKISSQRETMKSTAEFHVLCSILDWRQLFNGEYLPVMFEDKIVILGFLGDYLGDPSWEDKFFTPLNSKVAGRANPDMFGAVVHANIVAMILNEDYVNEIPEWLQYMIAFIICFANVYLLHWVDRKFPVWFDALQVTIQILEILVVSAFIVFVFATFNFKLDLTITLAALALIGPCFDIYKSLENTVIRRIKRVRLSARNADFS
jgi:CHASE2 domain-containing sensor protein